MPNWKKMAYKELQRKRQEDNNYVPNVNIPNIIEERAMENRRKLEQEIKNEMDTLEKVKKDVEEERSIREHIKNTNQQDLQKNNLLQFAHTLSQCVCSLFKTRFTFIRNTRQDLHSKNKLLHFAHTLSQYVYTL